MSRLRPLIGAVAIATVCTIAALFGVVATPAAEPTTAAPLKTTEPPAAASNAEMGWTGILGEEEFKALHALRTDDAPALRGRTIDLVGGKAYLSVPEGNGPFPGLVVIQEWWGLNDHVRHWADRLAADGYAALAVDLYEGKVATTPDEALAAMKTVDDARAAEVLRAAADYLRKEQRAPTIGTIGWCFGGGWSLRCALAWDFLDAAVIYYGRLVDDPAQIGKIQASVCGVFGTRDEGIPPAAVDSFEAALQQAGVTHEIWSYEADHAFANPSGARYDAANASAAWDAVRAFLARELKAK